MDDCLFLSVQLIQAITDTIDELIKKNVWRNIVGIAYRGLGTVKLKGCLTPSNWKNQPQITSITITQPVFNTNRPFFAPRKQSQKKRDNAEKHSFHESGHKKPPAKLAFWFIACKKRANLESFVIFKCVSYVIYTAIETIWFGV